MALKKYTYTRFHPVGDTIEQNTGKTCFTLDYNSDGSVKYNAVRTSSGTAFTNGIIQFTPATALHPSPGEIFAPANSFYQVTDFVTPSEWDSMCERVRSAVSSAASVTTDYLGVIYPSSRQGAFCNSGNINNLITLAFVIRGAGGVVNRTISVGFAVQSVQYNSGFPTSAPNPILLTYVTPTGGGGTAQSRQAATNKILSSIKQYFKVYISPQFQLQLSNYVYSSTRRYLQYPQLVFYCNKNMFSDGQYSSGDIFGFTSINANYATLTLTDTGQTVDPTDPGETPTPPIPPSPPDPPDPPNIPDPDDPIPPPNLPTIGGCGLGFFTVYNPSDVAMRLLATKFWTPTAFDAIKQDFQNPMETIIGFGIVPVKPTTGSAKNVKFGKYDSEVSALEVTSDYKIIDCGSRVLHTYYGSYLDFEPYTKVSMYLPYCGEVDMNPDEMIGKTVGVLYYVNVITGDIVAMVTADGTVIYTAASNCFRQLPMSQADYSKVIQSAISAVMALGAVVAGGAAGAAGASAMGAQGSLPGLVEHSATSGEVTQGAIQGMMNSSPPSMLNNVMSAKVHYKRASQLGTGSGQLSIQYPYMTVLRPNLMLPDGAGDVGTNSDLKAYKGYPCNQITPLSSCHGLTIVEDMRLAISGATVEELEETLSLLKGGAIL